ncbi:MAG: TetR/AcrR family transcriptional regulator [Alphaproteobacteria bacterium]
MREVNIVPVLDARTEIAAATPSKQDLIVRAARKLFLTAGYAVTSMDAIAAEAGVSKATVYSHFQNKEALFAGVMHDMCEESGGPKITDEMAGPPEVVLQMLGHSIAGKITDSQVISLLRVVLSGVAQFPELGRTYWQEGPGRARDMLAQYLADLARRGELEVPDPDMAAMQFIGIISGPFLLPLLLGVRDAPGQGEIDRVVDGAVAKFLAGLRLKGA